MKGLFGKMFDLNGDGKLDSLEKAIDYMVFQEMMNEDEEKDKDEEDD